MSYDENKQEIQETAHEMYENMFYCIPSKGLTIKEHDESAKKCAKLAALVGKHNTKNDKYWNLIISEIESI